MQNDIIVSYDQSRLGTSQFFSTTSQIDQSFLGTKQAID